MTLVYACKRHANPAYASKIRVCCFYCGDPTGPRAFTIDGREAHQKCHNEALKQ